MTQLGEALRKNWIGWSGQLWKIYLGLGGIVLALACLAMAILVGTESPKPFTAWMGAFVVASLVSFTWISASILCPFCRGCIGWWTVSKTSHEGWPLTILILKECPYCARSLVR